VLFIPVAYKNYGIAMLRINFVHYMVPAVIFYIPYLLFMVLVGASMSSLEQLTNDKASWKTMSEAEKVKLVFTLVLCAITVVIMIAFIIYTVIVFRRIRREIRERKLAEQAAEANKEDKEPVDSSAN
jgi:large-conductance mechanosensitive channel